MLKLTDDQLALAIKLDPATISLIVKKTTGPLYNLIFQMVRNREDAEDVLQETYIKMYNNLSGFRGESSLPTWLYRVATNAALEKLRKISPDRGIRDFQDEEFQEITINDRRALDEFNPERMMMNEEFKTVLNTYLQELPEKTRLVFVLRDQENLTLEEIVMITGDSDWSVKGRLKRARSFLREKLAGYLTEGEVNYEG
ncbi:MAG: sigma-70 family RNA polymerase sigma factor [Bacteroidetes bacterium]|nr:sigma-70 family RNA polymerase sigma factor [Bacteroidota bacterium]